MQHLSAPWSRGRAIHPARAARRTPPLAAALAALASLTLLCGLSNASPLAALLGAIGLFAALSIAMPCRPAQHRAGAQKQP